MEAHEIANVFPMLSDAELKSLAADIAENGLAVPITTYQGKILDGRNRYRACEIAGVDPTMEEYYGADPLAFVVSHNLIRRHLDESQRGMVGGRIATLKHGANQFKKEEGSDDPSSPTISEAAEMMNVGTATIKRARTVIAHGEAGLAEMVEGGDVSVKAAADLAKLPAPEQQAAIAKGPDAVKEAVKEVRTQRDTPEPAPIPKKRTPDYVPDDAFEIWCVAKSHLSRILPNDVSRVSVLQEIISYCEGRIANKK